jgi:hypothetical protein
MRRDRIVVVALTIVFTAGMLHAGESARYFKAEHGVAATYVKLSADGGYKVIDREHMGIFLRDEGSWQQTGSVITFTPTNKKKSSYKATVNKHHGKVFLAISSQHAAAGIVIPAEDTKKELNTNPKYLPDHVLFKISAKVYATETKQTYPFRYIGTKP